jgi:cytohesin
MKIKSAVSNAITIIVVLTLVSGLFFFEKICNRCILYNEGDLATIFDAVQYEDNKLLHDLLARGHNPDEEIDGGWTALSIAALGVKVDAVAILLAAGADANTRIDMGDTPLHLLFWPTSDRSRNTNDVTELVRLLIKYRADVNAKNKRGGTPLHGAASRSSGKVVSLLIANGADPNAADDRGYTPLFYAVADNNLDTAIALCDGSADMNVRVRDGKSLSDIAQQRGNTDIIDSLRIVQQSKDR